MQAKMTLIGLYNYLYDEDLDDPDVLFSGLTVPADTYDLDLLKATILLRGGGFEVMYPDPDFLIPMISAWSYKWANTMQRWWDAFAQTYSPIENYDRNESWTDTGSGTGSGNSSGSSSGTTGGTDEETVSAFDASTYTPKDKHTTSGTQSGTTSGQTSSSFSDSHTHTGRIHGNIGVTTNQQMIQAELDLYKQNLYDELADVFLMEFTIPVY